MFETELTIPEELLDDEYNHLHHAESLKLLEKGRLHYLDHIGIPQNELLQRDCFLVLSRCDVTFKRELKAGPIICTVQVLEATDDSSFVLQQQLVKLPKRVAVEARIELVSMSGSSRRRCALPQDLREKLRS